MFESFSVRCDAANAQIARVDADSTMKAHELDESVDLLRHGRQGHFGTPNAAFNAELANVVEAIARERRNRGFDAIRSLWRIGDVLVGLRDVTPKKRWRSVLQACALRIDMNASALYESVRVSEAFAEASRETLLRRFEEAGATLNPSHMIALARATPSQRARGVEALLGSTRVSVRQLRALLKLGWRKRFAATETE